MPQDIIGSYLKMNLIIPGTVQYQIGLIAEALRVESKDSNFIIAAKIVYIDDEARDSIIKTVFQKQRIDIRRVKTDQEG